MKTPLILLPFAVALTLAGCSSKPLTAVECNTLTGIEIGVATEGMTSESAESFKEFAEHAAETGTAKCVAGQTYNRDDYECLTAANSKPEKMQCLAKATAHIKR
ncbi:MAG TPA: hypothetical protein VKM35_06010 [Arenimonas sp.]|uniref:hypothetical protein n=1 Tax=Arenimonas sp. TaxID=1872635 RepID=UPI002CBDF72C|nr:hypothetical protein [Arenimonas sp.]HMB56745.1 hypothetical protein [Arenimonas sp.]